MQEDGAGRQGASDAGAPVQDDSWLDVPNCPDHLVQMEARETDSGSPYWACPDCDRTRVA